MVTSAPISLAHASIVVLKKNLISNPVGEDSSSNYRGVGIVRSTPAFSQNMVVQHPAPHPSRVGVFPTHTTVPFDLGYKEASPFPLPTYNALGFQIAVSSSPGCLSRSTGSFRCSLSGEKDVPSKDSVRKDGSLRPGKPTSASVFVQTPKSPLTPETPSPTSAITHGRDLVSFKANGQCTEMLTVYEGSPETDDSIAFNETMMQDLMVMMNVSSRPEGHSPPPSPFPVPELSPTWVGKTAHYAADNGGMYGTRLNEECERMSFSSRFISGDVWSRLRDADAYEMAEQMQASWAGAKGGNGFYESELAGMD